MAKVVTNTLRVRNHTYAGIPFRFRKALFASKDTQIQPNAKLLAWVIFLIFFIENGTLGLLPRELYFVHRNVRVSDLLIYGSIAYSIFCIKEYQEYLRSRPLFLLKLLLFYMSIHFIASVVIYQVNFIEYFFRLKLFWGTFMFLPYLLLLKRNGLSYFIKLIFPASVISNILYIITALTGVALLPDINITKTTFAGGIEVYRVFGGTFMGDLFFLGIIYYWVINKFKLYQLIFAVIFILPHVLALGRGAWMALLTQMAFILIFNVIRTRKFKNAVRQIVIIFALLITFIYVLTSFVPQSEDIMGALGERVSETETDIKFYEGTYRGRGISQQALLEYWSNNNLFFGIGMHPFWVIKPETEDEFIYHVGFSDLRWAPFLVSYGLVGLVLAILFQISVLVFSFKILRKINKFSIIAFFVLVTFSTFFFESFVYYTFILITFSHYGLTIHRIFYIAVLAYAYEHVLNPKRPLTINEKA